MDAKLPTRKSTTNQPPTDRNWPHTARRRRRSCCTVENRFRRDGRRPQSAPASGRTAPPASVGWVWRRRAPLSRQDFCSHRLRQTPPSPRSAESAGGRWVTDVSHVVDAVTLAFNGDRHHPVGKEPESQEGNRVWRASVRRSTPCARSVPPNDVTAVAARETIFSRTPASRGTRRPIPQRRTPHRRGTPAPDHRRRRPPHSRCVRLERRLPDETAACDRCGKSTVLSKPTLCRAQGVVARV